MQKCRVLLSLLYGLLLGGGITYGTKDYQPMSQTSPLCRRFCRTLGGRRQESFILSEIWTSFSENSAIAFTLTAVDVIETEQSIVKVTCLSFFVPFSLSMPSCLKLSGVHRFGNSDNQGFPLTSPVS